MEGDKEGYENRFWIFWKKYGDHITAPLILIALCILANGLYEDNRLQKEVSLNCGWGEEDYKCYCAKSEAMKIKNLMEGNFSLNFVYNESGAGLENISRDLEFYFNRNLNESGLRIPQ